MVVVVVVVDGTIARSAFFVALYIAAKQNSF